MIVVGMTGDIASGKTTFGNFLAAAAQTADHWESWQLIAEVGAQLRAQSGEYPLPDDLVAISRWLRPLPQIVQAVTGKTIVNEAVRLTPAKQAAAPDDYQKLFEHLRHMQHVPALQKAEISADNKEDFRSLLQWLGGYLVKSSDEGIWYDEILRRIAARSAIDLATIGGVRFPGEAMRIQRAGGSVLRIVRPHHAARDATDLTERLNKQIPTNSEITNSGSLEQLKRCAARVYRDLQAAQLAASYQASSF